MTTEYVEYVSHCNRNKHIAVQVMEPAMAKRGADVFMATEAVNEVAAQNDHDVKKLLSNLLTPRLMVSGRSCS